MPHLGISIFRSCLTPSSGGVAPPATPFASATFGGTSGNDLNGQTASDGGTWTKHTSYATGTLKYTSEGRVRSGSGGANALYWHSATPPSADYEVSADVVLKSDDNLTRMGVALRINTAADSYYYARWSAADNGWLMVKAVTGTHTGLHTAVTQALTVDQVYRLTFRAQGTTLTILIDDVQIAQVTDSTHSAAGKAGIFGRDAGGDASGLHLDNWEAIEV